MPAAISSLTALTWLSLANNQLTTLPAEISSLTALTMLSLANNQLTTLPAAISSLTALTRLDLDNNQLTTLPAEISSLTALTWLDLDINQLTTLPAEISSLTALTTLFLDINQLTTLPAEISSLTVLTRLTLDGNPLISPPPEIVEQGTSAILSFLRKILEETPSRVWVSKLLLVGEGGVGKTSLLRQLRGEGFVAGEATTHGIEIRELPLPHPEIDDVAMKLVAWDFGGQEIYHATHQFFLTNRSLFLLAWNARIGYEASKLDYWLETIKAKAPDSPVMIVATGIDDDRPVDLPLKELRAKFDRIVGLWKVSNSKGTGIDDLRLDVGKIAAGLPLMGERWPKTWLDAAETVRASAEQHISPHELFEIMGHRGVADEDQGILARWLHELGDLLYYQENRELDDVVILKPAWVNREICKVLDSVKVKDRCGIFRREDRDMLWSDVESGLRDLFLRLMEQYDLSYRTLADPDLSLVVEHLSLDEHKDFEAAWRAFGDQPRCKEVTMKFVLSVMPPGIPTWFIARSHRYSQGIHWKRGALFGDPRQSPEHLGLIRAMPSERTLLLTVRGPHPYYFFDVLRKGLEETLDRFPGMQISKKIPCPGHGDGPCPAEFDLEFLQGAMEQDPPEPQAQCPKRFKMVPISELLFGLDWRYDEIVHERLKEISENLGQARGELRDLAALVQSEFSRALRRDQQFHESECPAVFVLRPKGEGGWRKWTTGRKAELHLYCDAPGHWHPASETGCYEIDAPPKWLRAIAPHVRALVKVLKYAAPLVGPVLGYTLPAIQALVKEDVELMKGLIEKLPEIDTRKGLDPDEANDRWPNPVRGAALRELRAVLDGIRKTRTRSTGVFARSTRPRGIISGSARSMRSPTYRRRSSRGVGTFRGD